MNWDNVAWFQNEWVWDVGAGVLCLALVVSVIWFIDGVRKYGYWWNEEEENDE